MGDDARGGCCLLSAFVQLAQGPHDLQSLRVLHAGEEATVDREESDDDGHGPGGHQSVEGVRVEAHLLERGEQEAENVRPRRAEGRKDLLEKSDVLQALGLPLSRTGEYQKQASDLFRVSLWRCRHVDECSLAIRPLQNEAALAVPM